MEIHIKINIMVVINIKIKINVVIQIKIKVKITVNIVIKIKTNIKINIYTPKYYYRYMGNYKYKDINTEQDKCKQSNEDNDQEIIVIQIMKK